MATRIFDRETLLDLTVNIVPLAIMAFFVVVFLVVNPWGVDPLASGIQFALLLAPFVLLAILTYLSGKAIAGDETAESAETEAEAAALEAGEDGVDGNAEGETADGRAADPEPTTED
jgi:hypothetical protein